MIRILWSASLFVLGLMSTTSSYAEISFKQELQQDCAKITQYKQLGQNFYNQKQYKKALEQFKNQASWTPFCQLNGEEFGINISDQEVDIANNNVGLTYAKLGKPLWAKAWFQINEHSQLSQFNLKQLPKTKQTHDFSGKYLSYAGFGQWQYISVKKLNQTYHIRFDGLYMGGRGLLYGPNTGQFKTSMPLNKKVAKTAKCNITLAFGFNAQAGNYVSINQPDLTYGCEYFGMNVSADGVYLKVESE